MNFYKRHIGDYLKDTAHLSLLEHGIYSRLLDVYYTRESGIPDDQAARLIGARTKDEVAALKSVLAEFFTFENGIWLQYRCESEIQASHVKADKNREVGKLGGRPQKKETMMVSENNHDGFEKEPNDNRDGLKTEPKNNPSHKPLAISQEKEKETSSRHRFADDDFELAEFMFAKLRELNPEHKPPNLNAWAEDVRKIREIDKRRIEDIRRMFAWANADSFWRTNILSPSKLRQKWDTLAIKCATDSKPMENQRDRERREWYEQATGKSSRSNIIDGESYTAPVDRALD